MVDIILMNIQIYAQSGHCHGYNKTCETMKRHMRHVNHHRLIELYCQLTLLLFLYSIDVFYNV